MIKQTEKLVNMLGIQYPIIQAPMAGGPTTPELVAAVSNAGGLGSLGAGYMPPNKIKQAIQKIRALTDKPFAVNLFIPVKHHATSKQMQQACHDIAKCCAELNIKIEPAKKPYTERFEEQIQVVLEEKVPVFSCIFGILDAKWVTQLKTNQTILVATATSLTEAQMLEKSGIDIITAQGSEAGGHRGTFLTDAEKALTPLSDLVAQLAEKITIPIIAAGGIMNGKKIIAAINQGAAGVQMGTAFLSCPESGIHEEYKKTLLAQTQDSTVLTCAFSGGLARGIQNKFTTRMKSKTQNILDYPIQSALTSSMRAKAKQIGCTDFMSMWAGQSAELSRGISVSELINQLLSEISALY